MRDRALRGLILAASAIALVGAAPLAAQAPAGITLVLEPPASLVEGDGAEVIVVARISPPNDLPLLVTPRSEGSAVSVVRGRLLRADAASPEAADLQFRVPIVAHSAGTSVLRVRAAGWICAERCRQAIAEESVVLRVHRRSP